MSKVTHVKVGDEFSGYYIMRHIGGGGMAQIYLAKTRGLAGFEKYLALKVINAEYANEQRFIEMLINEAKIAVGLSHVNIAQVFDLGEYNGVYYIAMEYVDGLDVLELVNGLHAMGRRVPIEAVVYIGRQICSGLHYAHTCKDQQGKPLNIVHRDISPQNILVSRSGEVKVVDFGIAKAAGVHTKTQAGVIKGKVNYMAPEQVLGRKADARTDIFSVGIVVWEMLTSQMVYAGDNVEELALKVKRAAIAAPSSVRPEIPRELDTIVSKALSPTPEERFQTAHDFQVELTKFLSSTAPDYSASSLARLVEEVAGQRDTPPAPAVGASMLSHDDELQDQNSVIFHYGHPELILRLAQGEQVYTIGTELTIGRAGQLAVPDARVSRQHARVRRLEGRFLLEDLGSSNGTFLNEKRIAEPVSLRDGDTIRVGSCNIAFRVRREGGVEVSESDWTPAQLSDPTHLFVKVGSRTLEQPLQDDANLSYKFQIGPVQLTGISGRVVRRPNGYWLEPAPGRTAISYNGKHTTNPVRMSIGDTFEIHGVTFTVSR